MSKYISLLKITFEMLYLNIFFFSLYNCDVRCHGGRGPQTLNEFFIVCIVIGFLYLIARMINKSKP